MKLTPMAVGHLSTFYHTSFILEGTDWLEKAGLEIEWKLYASGPDILKAFETGEIGLGYTGLPPAMIGISRGMPLKCIAGGHVEGTVIVAQSRYVGLDEVGDLRGVLEQFRGGTMGTPPKGSIHDVIARDLIGTMGLDIEIKNYPWADFVLEALVDGEIHLAAGTPPLAVAARRYAGAKIVVPPAILWPNNPSYGILAREDVLGERDAIVRFLREHERACNLIREKPREAAQIVSDLTQTVEPGFVEETYRISPKYCAALSPEYVTSSMRFVDALRKLGYLMRLVSPNEIFERGPIDEVHPEGPHYNDPLNAGTAPLRKVVND